MLPMRWAVKDEAGAKKNESTRGPPNIWNSPSITLFVQARWKCCGKFYFTQIHLHDSNVRSQVSAILLPRDQEWGPHVLWQETRVGSEDRGAASLRSVVSGCPLPLLPSPCADISFFTEIMGVRADFLPFGEKTFLNTDTFQFCDKSLHFRSCSRHWRAEAFAFLREKVYGFKAVVKSAVTDLSLKRLPRRCCAGSSQWAACLESSASSFSHDLWLWKSDNLQYVPPTITQASLISPFFPNR